MKWVDDIACADITVSSDSNGLKAAIPCPLCATNVMIRPERTGTWKLSNFSSHIRAKHLCESQSMQRTVLKRSYPPEFNQPSGQPSPSVPSSFSEMDEEWLDTENAEGGAGSKQNEEEINPIAVLEHEPPALAITAENDDCSSAGPSSGPVLIQLQIETPVRLEKSARSSASDNLNW